MPSQNKPVYFNVETEKDLLAYVTSLGPGNFSPWVKKKLREEINLNLKLAEQGNESQVNREEVTKQEIQIKKELNDLLENQPVSKKSLVWKL